MVKKRYYVEQVEEDENKMKEQAETNAGGILQKDEATEVVAKVEQPVKDVEPKEPLEKAKALTEEVGSPSDEVLQQILSKLNDLDARIAGLETAKTDGVQDQGEEPKILEEEAIGFEGDTPSGPSLGAKADTSNGGLLDKSEDEAIKPKVEEPVKKVEPTDPLENAEKLTERIGRRTFVNSAARESVSASVLIQNAMKEYTRGGVLA